jgi:hypothetical protein
VSAVIGKIEFGQGFSTVQTQMVAEELDVPIRNVTGGPGASSSAFEASKGTRSFNMTRIDRTGIAPLGCPPAATSRMIEACGQVTP